MSRSRRIACALLAVVAGWACGMAFYAATTMLRSGSARLPEGVAIAFWTGLYILLGGLAVMTPIAAFADHRRRWLSPTWFPTVGALCGLATFLVLVGWWTGFWRDAGFIVHAMVAGFGAGLSYSLMTRAAGRSSPRSWLPGTLTIAAMLSIVIAQPLWRERQRRLEPRIWTFRWEPAASELTIDSYRPGTSLTDDELALVESAGLSGRLIPGWSREPLRTHPSQVLLLLRRPPDAHIDLPVPERGTIVVWQDESGALRHHPPGAALREPGRWFLEPSGPRDVMTCRGGQCWHAVRFEAGS